MRELMIVGVLSVVGILASQSGLIAGRWEALRLQQVEQDHLRRIPVIIAEAALVKIAE